MGRRETAGGWPVIGLCCLALVVGCTSGPGDEAEPAPSAPSARSEQPVTGGSVVVGLEAETSGWAPWEDALAASGTMVARSFYEPLLERDADGVPQPNLLAEFETNEDHTEFVLHVRKGISFHDGEPLDAAAVVANLGHLLRPFDGTEQLVEELLAEDESTVRIRLNRPHVAFADILAGQAGLMVSPAAFEEARNAPVGTGPFEFTSWRRDQELVVTRNEDYWREGLPYLDEIVFRPIPDEEARWQSLLAGDIDALQSLRQSIVRRARDRADDFNLFEHVGNESGGTIYNTNAPPLDDVRVRRAVAHALDREDLIAALDGAGISPLAQGLFNPDSFWFDPQTAELWPDHDPDRARGYVEEYVSDPQRSDGLATGAPVAFTVDTPPDPSLTETASVYQDQLLQVGIDVSIRTVEQAVHIQEAIGEYPDFDGDFEAKFWRLGSDGDPDWMTVWFMPGSPINFTNFEDDEVVRLLLDAQLTAVPEQRRELYTGVMAVFADQVPFTLSGHTVSSITTVPDLHGFDEWELPDGAAGVGHPGSQARWHQVWLDDPQR